MAKKKTFSWKRIALWGGIGFVAVTVLTIGVLLVMPHYQSNIGWQTLREAVQYADRMPELPNPDNTNKVRPDYTRHHRRYVRGYLGSKFDALRAMIGLKKTPEWTPSYFSHVLSETVARFMQYKTEKNVVYKVSPKTGTQFVVWGDLSGAFHSLVRCLQKLKELSIIDNEFKIVADDAYLVFMGDAISRSPYGMEALSLILRLIEVNPERVIYLRGNHEDKKYWHAFGLKEQLQVRAGSLDEHALVPKVDQFFNYLPLGLYLSIPGMQGHYARLSHLGRARSKKLKEERYAHFLNAPQQATLDRHQFSKSVSHNGAIKIDAIIRSEKKRHSFQTMDGIRLLEPDQGATSWTLMSSPTRVMQEGFKFFHDAFAIIKVGAHKATWSITLYAQDVRDKQGFVARSYQFFTGKQMSLEDIASQENKTKLATPQPAVKQPVAEAVPAPQAAPAAPVPASTTQPVTASPFMHQLARNLVRPRKVVRRVPVIKQPQPAPKKAVPVVTQTAQTTTVQPVGNQAVSVTVTPPAAGAADQSTIVAVSVKVPATSTVKTEHSDSGDKSTVALEQMPTVQPVVRAEDAAQEEEEHATSNALSSLPREV